jgi:hypothetical protein
MMCSLFAETPQISIRHEAHCVLEAKAKAGVKVEVEVEAQTQTSNQIN